MGTNPNHFVQIWTKKGHKTTAYQMQREIAVHPNIPFKCSDFFPYDGPNLLDDIVVLNNKTMFYFTTDTGTVITAQRA